MSAIADSIEEAQAWTAALTPTAQEYECVFIDACDGSGQCYQCGQTRAQHEPANVVPFPIQAKPPEPQQNAPTASVAPARSVSDWVTTADLRSLLKSKLGLNARQVTAKRRHSSQYLDLIIRDASVDVAKVQEFAGSLNTWSMDNTDYCSGQSVNVSTTREVDAIHAAPHLDEARAAVAKIMADECGCGTRLANGKLLWKSDNGYNGYYVSRDLNGPRGQYVNSYDVEQGTDWAIAAIALQIARV